MARVDQLSDAWEGVLGAREGPVEHRIFVNCWTAQDSESHAMWRIFCQSSEGVAIQTTLSKLKSSVEHFPVLPVKYVTTRPPRGGALPPLELATRKRKPFQYEKEHRIVHVPASAARGARFAPPPDDANHEGSALIVTELYGFPLSWDPDKWVETVLIHPGADFTFHYVVKAVVDALAPTLSNRIRRSGMAARPPKVTRIE
jgi:hypothetical protein